MMNETEIMMHLASQYLAAAGISFVAKKDDDSHTNLRFDVDGAYLETHPLSTNGDTLSLNYTTFSLDWLSPDKMTSFALDGKTHKEVLQWITEVSAKKLNKTYVFKFHYDLPYELEYDYTFHLKVNEFEQLAQLRTLAENTLNRVIRDNQLKSTVRIWPHHFDTGAYSPLKENDKVYVGLGLAIPDSICATHYFYCSGYTEEGSISPKDFKALSRGKWLNSGFKGAILSAENTTMADATQFFNEAIRDYSPQKKPLS